MRVTIVCHGQGYDTGVEVGIQRVECGMGLVFSGLFSFLCSKLYILSIILLAL